MPKQQHYLLGCILALSLSGSAMATAITDTPFPSARNFSMIVTGTASLGSGQHVHGAAYVGANLSLTGSNMEVSMDNKPTPAGLVVGGNVQVGASGSQIAMHNTGYFVGGTAPGVTFRNGTRLSSNPVESLASISQGLSDKSAQLKNLTSTGVVIDKTNANNVKINLQAGAVNVLSLNSSNGSFLADQNGNLTFNNFTAGTKVVINYDLSSNLNFRTKIQDMGQAYYDDIIWNFIGKATLNVANSVSTFQGSIFAPDASITWSANDLNGQLVANNLNWRNTSEIHFYQPWTASSSGGGTGGGTPVPAPGVLLLMLPELVFLARLSRANSGLASRAA